MSSTMLTIIFIIMLLLLAGVEIAGAHLITKPCKLVKYAYGLSALIAAGGLLTNIIIASHSGYRIALGLLIFNMLVGGTARLVSTLKHRRECECER